LLSKKHRVLTIIPIDKSWWLRPTQPFHLGALAWSLVVLTWFDRGALAWAVVGSTIGGLWLGPYRQLPVRLSITTRGEARHVVGDLKALLPRLEIGYNAVAPGATAGHAHYRHKGAVWLRGWFYAPEQDIDQRWTDHAIELDGPINAVEWLRNSLLKQLEANMPAAA
jgi:hypothetical protein